MSTVPTSFGTAAGVLILISHSVAGNWPGINSNSDPVPALAPFDDAPVDQPAALGTRQPFEPGKVPASSHMEGATSELRVHGFRIGLHHPEVIGEVRRILV